MEVKWTQNTSDVTLAGAFGPADVDCRDSLVRSIDTVLQATVRICDSMKRTQLEFRSPLLHYSRRSWAHLHPNLVERRAVFPRHLEDAVDFLLPNSKLFL